MRGMRSNNLTGGKSDGAGWLWKDGAHASVASGCGGQRRTRWWKLSIVLQPYALEFPYHAPPSPWSVQIAVCWAGHVVQFCDREGQRPTSILTPQTTMTFTTPVGILQPSGKANLCTNLEQHYVYEVVPSVLVVHM